MLGKITHGFLGQGDITVEKFYELPIQLDVDYGEIIVENKIEREIEITVKTQGGGGIIIMNDILLKQKERKILKFTYKNVITKEIIPLIGATFSLIVLNDNDTPIITKNDIDFDKTNVIDGVIRVTLTEIDLNQSIGQYKLQIKTIFSNGEIDKSTIFSVNISESLFN